MYSVYNFIVALFQDTITLEKLDLRGNWIEGEGGEAVARMLEENDYVTDVVSLLNFKFVEIVLMTMEDWTYFDCYCLLQCLADNKLGLMGAQSLCRMLNTNAGLRKLDISGIRKIL